MTAASRVRPGSVVAWWDGNSLEFGAVVGEEKQRILLVTRRGKQERVGASRVAFEVVPPGEVPGATPEERRAVGERLCRLEDRLRERAASVDVRLLWEIVSEDREAAEEGAVSSLDELAALALESSAGESRAALALALLEDGLHFTRKGESWEGRAETSVRELRLQRERVSERESETHAVFEALRRAARGESYVRTGSEVEAKYLDALERYAIEEEAAQESVRARAREALEASGIGWDRPAEGAFRLLRRVGTFDSDDENLQLRRYRLRPDFPPEVLQQARLAARQGFARDGRTDLTRIETFTIDGPHTKEIDDALSLESGGGGGWRLGIHIAEPGVFARPGDPLDREALSRAVTHYLPELRVNMLPGEISEAAASLSPDDERPALSFLVDLDPRAEIADYRIERTVVRSRARLDYGNVDRTIESGEGRFAGTLADLAEIARLRELLRLEAGALILRAPEIDVHVDAAGSICLERVEADSPSRRIVSEAMILAGQLAARFCSEAGLPAIYRRQAVASDLPERPTTAVHDPVSVRGLRRFLKRGEAGLLPGPHAALGLPAYAQVTSPLRRYQDLATQRQISARLAGEPPPYDETELRRVAATTDQVEQEARRAERTSHSYWILRYLEGQTGRWVDGLVVELEPRPVVELAETLWVQPMPSLSGATLGQAVRLRIERVNPRAQLLVLRGEDRQTANLGEGFVEP